MEEILKEEPKEIDFLGRAKRREKIVKWSLMTGFVVLLVWSLYLNFRPGFFMTDPLHLNDIFFVKTRDGIYKNGEEYIQIEEKASGNGFVCRVELADKKVQADITWEEVDSPYGDKKVTVEFLNAAETYERIWSYDEGELVDEEGTPLRLDHSTTFKEINGVRTFSKYRDTANLLCSIVFGDVERNPDYIAIFLGCLWYLAGILEFLYPEKMHQCFNGWRYSNQVELSDTAKFLAKAGGVFGMVLGASFLLKIFVLG